MSPQVMGVASGEGGKYQRGGGLKPGATDGWHLASGLLRLPIPPAGSFLSAHEQRLQFRGRRRSDLSSGFSAKSRGQVLVPDSPSITLGRSMGSWPICPSPHCCHQGAMGRRASHCPALGGRMALSPASPVGRWDPTLCLALVPGTPSGWCCSPSVAPGSPGVASRGRHSGSLLFCCPKMIPFVLG